MIQSLRRRNIPARVKHRVDRRAAGDIQSPCETRIEGVCDDSRREYHHRRPWAKRGRHTYANVVLACDTCHTWIHSNEPLAAKIGLILARHPRKYWRR